MASAIASQWLRGQGGVSPPCPVPPSRSRGGGRDFVRQQLTPSKLCVKCDVIFQSTAPIPRSFDQSRTASRVQPADWMPADGSAAKAVWTPTVPLSHIKVFSARAEICFMCVIVGNEQNTVYVGKAVKRQFINEIVTSGASLAWHGQRHS